MEIKLVGKDSITKADINYIANDLIKKLDDGEISGLLLLEKFKALETVQTSIKEVLTKAAIREASLYPEKNLELYGAVFTIKNAGTSYDYSLCGDPKHVELLAKVEEAKKELKKREDFLKGISGSETIVDTSTGEVISVYPPSVKSSTIVQCSIK